MPTLPAKGSKAWQQAAAANRAFCDHFRLPRPTAMPMLLPDGRSCLVQATDMVSTLLVDDADVGQAQLYVLAMVASDLTVQLAGWATQRDLRTAQLIHIGGQAVRSIHFTVLRKMDTLAIWPSAPAVTWHGETVAQVQVGSTPMGTIYRIWRHGRWQWVADRPNLICGSTAEAITELLAWVG